MRTRRLEFELLITECVKEVSPFLPHPCHFQDYDRSMLYPAHSEFGVLGHQVQAAAAHFIAAVEREPDVESTQQGSPKRWNWFNKAQLNQTNLIHDTGSTQQDWSVFLALLNYMSLLFSIDSAEFKVALRRGELLFQVQAAAAHFIAAVERGVTRS